MNPQPQLAIVDVSEKNYTYYRLQKNAEYTLHAVNLCSFILLLFYLPGHKNMRLKTPISGKEQNPKPKSLVFFSDKKPMVTPMTP